MPNKLAVEQPYLQVKMKKKVKKTDIISSHCDLVCRYFKINDASFLGESSIIHYAGPSGAKTKAEFKLA